VKNTLKSNHNHTLKHPLNVIIGLPIKNGLQMSRLYLDSKPTRENSFNTEFIWVPSYSQKTTHTTRKLINTNRNTKGIFSSVNFREILLTVIFPRYIPRELPWEKKLKQSKKNDDVSFLPTELPMKFIPSVNLLVNCEHYSSCQLQRESPMEFSVGIF